MTNEIQGLERKVKPLTQEQLVKSCSLIFSLKKDSLRFLDLSEELAKKYKEDLSNAGFSSKILGPSKEYDLLNQTPRYGLRVYQNGGLN